MKKYTTIVSVVVAVFATMSVLAADSKQDMRDSYNSLTAPAPPPPAYKTFQFTGGLSDVDVTANHANITVTNSTGKMVFPLIMPNGSITTILSARGKSVKVMDLVIGSRVEVTYRVDQYHSLTVESVQVKPDMATVQILGAGN